MGFIVSYYLDVIVSFTLWAGMVLLTCSLPSCARLSSSVVVVGPRHPASSSPIGRPHPFSEPSYKYMVSAHCEVGSLRKPLCFFYNCLKNAMSHIALFFKIKTALQYNGFLKEPTSQWAETVYIYIYNGFEQTQCRTLRFFFKQL